MAGKFSPEQVIESVAGGQPKVISQVTVKMLDTGMIMADFQETKDPLLLARYVRMCLVAAGSIVSQRMATGTQIDLSAGVLEFTKSEPLKR